MQLPSEEKTKSFYCQVCDDAHPTLEECKKHLYLRNKIIEHNFKRRDKNKGLTTDTKSIWIFTSSVWGQYAKRINARGFFDYKYNAIYIPLKNYYKNNEWDIEALINNISHEYIHLLLYKEHGNNVTTAWDNAKLRLQIDSGGYLGFPDYKGKKYYLRLLDKQLKRRNKT